MGGGEWKHAPCVHNGSRLMGDTRAGGGLGGLGGFVCAHRSACLNTYKLPQFIALHQIDGFPKFFLHPKELNELYRSSEYEDYRPIFACTVDKTKYICMGNNIQIMFFI